MLVEEVVVEDEFDCVESGRLGVNDAGRTPFEAEGVFGTMLLRLKDMAERGSSVRTVVKCKGRDESRGRECQTSPPTPSFILLVIV